MRNRYYGIRHGESAANVAGLVVSDPAIGTIDYGLTATGRDQVIASVHGCVGLDSATVIHCSDFLRTRETAELAATILECAPPVSDPRLRERFFGQWDMSTNTGYEEVWAMDERDPHHTHGGTESVETVRDRLRALVQSIEGRHEDATVLLVSHGDPLQILQTLIENLPAASHRSLEPWGTAEIRRLV